MTHRRAAAIALAGILGASSASAAGLAWERQIVEATAQPGQKVVHAAFPFRNAGDKAVTITSVETSCRCTRADTAKATYAPGESGAVSVDFTVGGWTGVVDKEVTVTTDGPGAKPVVLTLRVTILEEAPAKPPAP